VAAFAVLVHLAGCDAESPSTQDSVPTVAASMTAPVATPASPSAMSDVPRAGIPARDSQGTNTPVATGTPEEMLQGWSQALESRDFGLAHSYFGDGGTSAAGLAKAWDKYRTIKVDLGKGRTEGAAGSLYYEAPVTVTGTTRDDKPYRLTGTVTARRVNDVPGASAEQLRWHIERTTLDP
jgi:hypothetical protein